MNTRKVLVAVALAVLVAMVPSAANADAWADPDPDNPKMDLGDIQRVRLNHTDDYAIVRIRFYDWDVDGVRVFFDTRRRAAGPEFALSFYYADPGGWYTDLDRVHGFDDAGSYVDCNLDRSGFDGDIVWFEVPRGCLNIRGITPRAVRVTVRSTEDGMTDWAPRHQAFGNRWVKAG